MYAHSYGVWKKVKLPTSKAFIMKITVQKYRINNYTKKYAPQKRFAFGVHIVIITR